MNTPLIRNHVRRHC